MELIAQKPFYSGHGRMVQPGDRITVHDRAIAQEMLASGKARFYETKVIRAARQENTPGLISCIMPTANRREWVPRAIELFQAQTYASKELIIIDSGASVEDIIPKHPDIRYVRLQAKLAVGALRNLACSMAKGEFIAHWDDDDWYHPRRLEEQVAALGDKQVTGYHKAYFHQRGSTEAHLYTGKANFGIGSSLLYRRSYWENHKFPPVNVGEDIAFTDKAASEGAIVASDGRARFVASIHPQNTSPRQLKTPSYKTAKASDLPDEYRP